VIDFHVLIYEGTEPSQLQEAIGSVHGPGTVHVVQNHGRSIFEGRVEGYQLGTADYVSYLDHDDLLLLPVDDLNTYLEQQEPDAVFTNSRIVMPDGRITLGVAEEVGPTYKYRPHNLCVFRRDYISEILDRLRHRSTIMASLAQGVDTGSRREVLIDNKWTYWPEIMYQWNHHRSVGSIKYHPDIQAVNAFYDRLTGQHY
jgi:hypothetical protein